MGDPARAAVSAPPDGMDWQSIDWQSVNKTVRRLQVRIAKAVREKRWGKVRSLKRILTRSLAARRLAVRRVTTNQGKRTPGIDGVAWNTTRKKMQAVYSLKRRGYRPQPLRRIYIPKRNGRRRPLGIPTMKDRAMQALYHLALEPVEDGVLHATEKGTPQGGIISPVLANLALDGLEACVQSAVPSRRPGTAIRSKVHVIRYADDLVVTANSREILENQVIPALTAFLQERGLNLSAEKSRITHIDDGFEFLGAHLRKYKGKFLMKPTKANMISFARDIKEYIQNRRGIAAEHLIHQLNRRLRGWGTAFRHLVSSRVFQYVDTCVNRQLWRWARKRHGNKGLRWIFRRYYRRRKDGTWVFATQSRSRSGRWKSAALFRLCDLRIHRHVKVRAKASVYDPSFDEYFEDRRILQRNRRHRDHLRWQGLQQLKWTT